MQSERHGLISQIVHLGAGDAGPVAAITGVPNKILRLVTCQYDQSTSAAQTLAVESTGGVDVIRLAASTPVGHYGFSNLIEGFAVPGVLAGEGLQITVSGAGNAGTLYLQYYWEQTYIQ
jgi:hypothetical protein